MVVTTKFFLVNDTKCIYSKDEKNLYGRSVRLDTLCLMKDGSYINVEIQKADDDNHLKRTRFNVSCITANVSEPGENFEYVKDVYIVYISKFDVLKKAEGCTM